MGNPKVKTPPQLGLVSFPFKLGEDGVHVLLETRFSFRTLQRSRPSRLF